MARLVSWLLVLFGLQFPIAFSQIETVSVSVNSFAARSQPVDVSFTGFAFEEASFYNYAFDANGNPNIFSRNLINQVLNYTSGTPILRVGGTSGDKGSYVASQTTPVNEPATSNGPATSGTLLTVGPSFFEAFANFPGMKYIFMVPLLNKDLDNTLAWTKQGLKYIGDSLEALEIGNEPNAYSWFTIPAYVKEYNKFLNALASGISSLNKRVFQTLDTASAGTGALPISSAIKAGLNTTDIKQVAFHYYQGSDAEDGLSGLQSRIANHTAIVEGMAGFVPNIQYLQKNYPNVPFILSEVGNTLGSMDTHQRNNLATALWNVDFQMHAMAINVARVNMQQIVYPGYQMWEPVPNEYTHPLVRPNYYSQPLVASFIGSSGTTTVSEITSQEMLAAYAAFESSSLARVAIVNLDLWNNAGSRPVVRYTIDDVPSGASSAHVQFLTAPEGAYATRTVTFDGLRYTYANQGLPVRVLSDAMTIPVVKGSVTIPVNATSAALVHFT